MQRDLTQGSITKNLVYVSIPTMLGFMAQTLYDVVDMIWIGRISGKAVAAVTVFATIFWVVEVLNEIIGTSSVSLISQSYGANNKEKTKRVIEQTLTFKALVAILAGVLLFLTLKPLIKFFSTDPLVYKYALDYGYLRIFFLPLMFSSFSVNTALRCIGDAKKPMYIMFTSALLNLILDPIFIFEKVPFIGIPGLGLGVYGAALATVISITIAFLLGFWFLLSGKSNVKISLRGLFRLDKKIDIQLITIGLPAGVEALFRNMSGFIILKMVALYGTAAIATAGIGNRLFGLAFMPLLGFSMGGSTIVGQNLGVNNIERAEKTSKVAAKIGMYMMLFVNIIVFAFSKEIFGIFVDEANVINMGVGMLRIVMPGMIGLGILFGLATVFTGSGYNLPFLLSSVISRWGFQIPFLYIAVYIFKLPITIIWVGYLVAELVELLVIVIAYKQGKWRIKRVLQS
ncbi:MAG: MATE family efflux transporter [Halanaerobiales bacterium]|nr:MATE family efflux transporter [Halanaerobiales bacterium]